MKLPEYITVAEVKRVCSELKIRDWTELKEPAVPIEEAKIILPMVNTGGMEVDIEEFRKGLEVELEHGTSFSSFNVTNNHPVLTAKIVMAHFMETPDYYRLLNIKNSPRPRLYSAKPKQPGSRIFRAVAAVGNLPKDC